MIPLIKRRTGELELRIGFDFISSVAFNLCAMPWQNGLTNSAGSYHIIYGIFQHCLIFNLRLVSALLFLLANSLLFSACLEEMSAKFNPYAKNSKQKVYQETMY